MELPEPIRRMLMLGAGAAVYAGVAVLGFSLETALVRALPVYLAPGVGLALLWRFGLGFWPAITLGAGVTWTEMIEADLPRYFDTLKAAGREVGGVQIQNRGTIAGNICNASPAADGVPALIALDAEVEVSGQGGIRRIAVSEFIQGNRRTALQGGELVTAIYVPRRSSRALSNFYKLGARRYLVISIAMVAVVVDIHESGAINHARVAIGSCSEVAQRLSSLEKSMIGRKPDEDLSALVNRDTLSPLSPIDDIRADAAYRMEAAQSLVLRALADLGTGS